VTGPAPLLSAAKARADAFADRLGELVGIDSGSRDLDGLAAMAERVAELLAGAGMTVARVPVADGAPLGDAVVGRLRGRGGRRVLLAGHLDTVFPRGTAAARPFSVDAAGIARGPGVCDDAGGVLAGVAAVEVLRELALDGFGEIVLVATPDEEIGSPGSRDLLAALGAEADVVLGLECARADGNKPAPPDEFTLAWEGKQERPRVSQQRNSVTNKRKGSRSGRDGNIRVRRYMCHREPPLSPYSLETSVRQ